MTEFFFSVNNPIGQEIDTEARRRVARIMENVAEGKTTIEMEIKRRGDAT